MKDEVNYRVFARPAPTILEMRGIRCVVDDPTDPGTADPKPEPKTDPKPDEQLGEAGQKALKAERARAAAAEKKVAELEAEAQKRADAELSEIDRLKKENAALAEGKTKAERDALRTSVAAAKKLPESFADRLKGETREELEADADSLLAAFPTSSDPKPDPSIGPKNDAPGGTLTAGEQAYRERHPAK